MQYPWVKKYPVGLLGQGGGGISSLWVAIVAYGDESGVLQVGPLPVARLRPV